LAASSLCGVLFLGLCLGPSRVASLLLMLRRVFARPSLPLPGAAFRTRLASELFLTGPNKHKTRTRLPDCGPVAPMHSLALVPSRSESRSDQPNSPKEFSGRSQKKFYFDLTSYLTHPPPFRCTPLILHFDQIKQWELRLLELESKKWQKDL
jgi:hypothetical protein